MDFSVVVIFTKLKRLLAASKTSLIFTSVSEEVEALLKREIFSSDPAAYRAFPDLDRGLEWCEERVLETFAEVGLTATPRSSNRSSEGRSRKISKIYRTLIGDIPSADVPLHLDQNKLISALKGYLIRHEVGVGVVLTDQEVTQSSIHFVQSGKVEVRRTDPNGRQVRLRVLGAGTCIGEIGFYGERPASATVITLEPSVVYSLDSEALRRMEAENPALASTFHRFMAHILSERMVFSTDELELAMQ